MTALELANLGILIRSYSALPPARSYIVYCRGSRISPGDMQEDGFRSRARAQQFADEFAALLKKYEHQEGIE